MYKFLVLNIFLLLGVLCMLKAFDFLMPFYFGNNVAREKFEKYIAGSQRENIVFFGASRVHHQIIPAVFDSVLGAPNMSSFNLGSRVTFNPESYWLVENFILSDISSNVNVIVLEIQDLSDVYPKNSMTTRGYYWSDVKQLTYVISFVNNTRKSFVAKAKIVLKYVRSFLFKQIDISRLSFLRNSVIDEPDVNRGFEPLLISRKLSEYDLEENIQLYKTVAEDYCLIKGTQTNGVNEAHLRRLKEIEGHAQKKNIEIFYLLPPRIDNYEFAIDLMGAIPENKLIDLSCPQNYPAFYSVEFSLDRGHFNEAGAYLFTVELANQLNSKLSK